jgi:hypothetical protein
MMDDKSGSGGKNGYFKQRTRNYFEGTEKNHVNFSQDSESPNLKTKQRLPNLEEILTTTSRHLVFQRR